MQRSYTLKLCAAVAECNRLHEVSWQKHSGGYATGRYSRDWRDCAKEAVSTCGCETELIDLVWFLALSGEGVDICSNLARKLQGE